MIHENSSSYEYLKKYIGDQSLNGNWFLPVSEKEVLEAELQLGIRFPSELKNFYREIGSGFLAGGCISSRDKIYSVSNHIFSPQQLSNIVLLGSDSGLIVPGASEYMTPGDLPFFEIGDSESFLVMKPRRENPNAIYDEGGILIEKTFEKFIYRLYYESPSFYEDIIQKAMKK